MRKIIQIAATGHQHWCGIYALCDDGTAWELYTPKPDSQWVQLPSIPQPKENVQEEQETK